MASPYVLTLQNHPGFRLELPRVSDILGVLDKPGLPPWYWKEAMRAIASTAADQSDRLTEVLSHGDPDRLNEFLKSLKRTPWHSRDKAMTRGTSVHQYLADHLTGLAQVEMDLIPPEHHGYIKAGLAWATEAKPKVIAVEQVVVHLGRGYAGTADLVMASGIVDGDGGRKGIVVDFKTSARAYWNHHLQLAAYQGAWNDMVARDPEGGNPIAHGGVVLLREDGTFEEIFGQATPEDFYAAMDLWRTRTRIEGSNGARR